MVVSIVALIAATSYLLGQNLTENQRNQRQIDKIRQPICSIMYIGLSHPPATAAQAEVRGDYLNAYGPSGLKCPKPLPVLTANETEEPK
jgi:hypothetical protein